MFSCLFVCLVGWLVVHLCACLFVCLFVCLFECLFIHGCLYVCTLNVINTHAHMHVCIYVYTCIYIYILLCICTCGNTCIYIYIVWKLFVLGRRGCVVPLPPLRNISDNTIAMQAAVRGGSILRQRGKAAFSGFHGCRLLVISLTHADHSASDIGQSSVRERGQGANETNQLLVHAALKNSARLLRQSHAALLLTAARVWYCRGLDKCQLHETVLLWWHTANVLHSATGNFAPIHV